MTQVIIPPGTETTPQQESELPSGGVGLLGTEGPDRLPGTDAPDVIGSQLGNDLIAGGGGDDNILLDRLGNVQTGGADTAVGGTGNDSVQGGRGNDSIQGNVGDDCLRGGRDNDIIEGGLGNDTLYGDRGEDVVVGGDGEDTIFGGQDTDVLSGGSGNDSIRGGKGNDSLDGGIGNDTLWGDRGSDILTGGAGADVFGFGWSGNGSFGTDTITDFTDGEDRIGLNGNDFNLPTGTLSADQFVVIEDFLPNGSAGISQAIIYNPNSGLIFYNPTDGVGDEAAIARVDPGTAIDNTDFEIF